MPVSKAKEALAKHLSGMKPAERALVFREIQRHSDYVAMQKLSDALEQAHLSPEVSASEVMSSFTFLIRETLAEFVPGTDLGNLVEPLRRLLSNHGGGRKPKADPDQVMKTQTALEAAWHPSPQKEAANKHGITDRTVRNYANREKKKPG